MGELENAFSIWELFFLCNHQRIGLWKCTLSKISQSLKLSFWNLACMQSCVCDLTLLVRFHPASPALFCFVLWRTVITKFLSIEGLGGAGGSERDTLTAFLTMLSSCWWNVFFLLKITQLLAQSLTEMISEYFSGINLNQCNVWKHFSSSNSWRSLDSIITNCNTLSSLFTKSLVRDFECAASKHSSAWADNSNCGELLKDC